jgi:hypothetical protein
VALVGGIPLAQEAHRVKNFLPPFCISALKMCVALFGDKISLLRLTHS